MFPFDLEIVGLNKWPTELSKASDTHVSMTSGHIAATKMSVRLKQVSVCFHVLTARWESGCIYILTVVKVLLRLRSPESNLIHGDKMHSENVATNRGLITKFVPHRLVPRRVPPALLSHLDYQLLDDFSIYRYSIIKSISIYVIRELNKS